MIGKMMFPILSKLKVCVKSSHSEASILFYDT